MSDAPANRQFSFGGGAERTADSLASQALSVLASRRIGRPAGMSERFLSALQCAACNADATVRDRVVRDMIAARINRYEIADQYIPEIARRLGVAWCEDGMSFAEVTIGVARLQGLLRDLTDNWSVESRMYENGLNSVVLMLADEYHTLGPMLVTSQLRRMGASVRLMLGRPSGEIRALLGEQRFDLVLVSVAHVEKLEAAARLVRLVRVSMISPAPVIVGGPAIDVDSNAKEITGADHASSNIREALALCGLTDNIRPPCFRSREI